MNQRTCRACLAAAVLSLTAGCSPEDRVTGSDPVAATAAPDRPAAQALPEEFAALRTPWFGDLDGLLERRIVRVVVPFGGYQFYYDNGEPRGAVQELLRQFELYVNRRFETRHIRIRVVAIPAARNRLIPDLVEGHADLIAADLTITPARQRMLRFSRPLLTGINEVLVTGPAADPVASMESLSGRAIFVRRSSSYFEHLAGIARKFEEAGLEAPVIVPADERLEAEDILELVDAGFAPATVLDDYKADFWSGVFDNLEVRHDIVINEGGRIAWAVSLQSPEFGQLVDDFLREYGRGTLVGNDIFNRYLADADRLRCETDLRPIRQLDEIAGLFEAYGREYGFDGLMLAAQGYQESRLDQAKRSPVGAVGIMQIRPSTAADPNVGIDDVSTVENNIHAGARYMRFIADRYFADAAIDDLDRWLLTLAAYNAGPARIIRLRRLAAEAGYDPDRWFDNVEIIAARRIGRETVEYVSNIYKYYVGYRATAARVGAGDAGLRPALTGCAGRDSVSPAG